MKRHHLYLIWFLLLTVSCQSGRESTPAVLSTATPTQTLPITMAPSATNTPSSTPPTIPTATLTLAPPTPLPPSATATPTLALSPTPSPTPAPPPEATIDVNGATLPPGFSLITYAQMVRPTGLAFDANGRLYATSADGTVHLFTDLDGDGRADSDSRFALGFTTPLGITVHPQTGQLFVSSIGRITLLQDTDGDDVADEISLFADDLPTGRHQNNNLKFGPDGYLYMGLGSTCDACVEVDERSATIMRFDPDTGAGDIFATGLRNAYDLAFHPITGDLFATENGRDDLGNDVPQEELNHIIFMGDYGWPDCWDEGMGTDCAGTLTAVAFFESHASANSLDFYTGDAFPPPYQTQGDTANAYVAVFGSWLKAGVQTGVMQVTLTQTADGTYHSHTQWFAQWPGAMPLGLIIGPDGGLYVGDYINDRIYLIRYGS